MADFMCPGRCETARLLLLRRNHRPLSLLPTLARFPPTAIFCPILFFILDLPQDILLRHKLRLYSFDSCEHSIEPKPETPS